MVETTTQKMSDKSVEKNSIVFSGDFPSTISLSEIDDVFLLITRIP